MIPHGYRHHTRIEVRFADLDVMGHLNHAKYLTYMEQARIRYVQEVCGWRGAWPTMGMILAKMTVEYRLPVAYGDSVSVYTRCARLGGKSFDLAYVLVRHRPDAPDSLCAEGLSVMVAYDYSADRTIPVPQTWRDGMMAYEPQPIALN